MGAEMILVLFLTAIFVGFVVVLAIHTRRERRVAQETGLPTSPRIATNPELKPSGEIAKT